KRKPRQWHSFLPGAIIEPGFEEPFAPPSPVDETILADDDHRALVGDAEPFEDSGRDRYLIAIRQRAHQRHGDLLGAGLLPEGVERHQEERSERVRLSLDLAVL